jgi:hypothetical protein
MSLPKLSYYRRKIRAQQPSNPRDLLSTDITDGGGGYKSGLLRSASSHLHFGHKEHREQKNATMTDKLDIEGLLVQSKAAYRRLGKSGLRVSVPILGAMSIGSSKWQPWVIEEEESLPLLKAAFDRGLTTWDTGTPIVAKDDSY